MKITFVLPTVNMSGGIKVAAIYAEALTQMGHTVRVVSPPVRQRSLRQKVKSLLKGQGWPRVVAYPRSHLDGRRIDHVVLDCWRPVVDADVPDADVVVATWWETAEWVNKLAPNKGAKVYFVQHHEVFSHLPVERCHATYRFPMHKIVVASWLKNVMASQYGDHGVDVVPNGVDHSQFFAPPRGKRERPTVGFLYATVAFKGVDTTLAAIRIVQEKLPQLRLLSFGSEPARDDLPLPEGAEYQVSPPQDRIRSIYASCDVWVTASTSEGFNLPAMEAMACRTPVVSTRAGWPEEAVQTGQNGVLVDVGDTVALANGIDWVLRRNDEEWRGLSSGAYATVASSSWEKSTRKFEQALKHACQRAVLGQIAGTPKTRV